MPHNDLVSVTSSQNKWLIQALFLAVLLHLLALLIPTPEKPQVQASNQPLSMTLQKKQTPKVITPPPEPEPKAKVMTQVAKPKKNQYRAKAPEKKTRPASAVKVAKPQAETAPTNEVAIAGLDIAVGTPANNKPKPLILDYASVKHLVEAPQNENGAIRSQQGSDKNKAIFGIWERQIRQKVERIGQQNFPRDENNRPLFGLMQFQVVLNADGSIASLQLTRSSGNSKLDQDALNIIRIAAPFGPVPVELLDQKRQIMLLRYYDFVDERNVRWKQ